MARPAELHVGPVIAVGDLDTARDFYEGKLGLDGEPAPGGWVLHADGGTRIYLLSEFENAGSADWPLASFQVSELRTVVREYRSRGVDFLEADDVPFELDEDGISVSDGMQVAWVTDPDGSVLTFFELTG